jgi:hypothetical protein
VRGKQHGQQRETANGWREPRAVSPEERCREWGSAAWQWSGVVVATEVGRRSNGVVGREA